MSDLFLPHVNTTIPYKNCYDNDFVVYLESDKRMSYSSNLEYTIQEFICDKFNSFIRNINNCFKNNSIVEMFCSAYPKFCVNSSITKIEHLFKKNILEISNIIFLRQKHKSRMDNTTFMIIKYMDILCKQYDLHSEPLKKLKQLYIIKGLLNP